ncbi:hypothetical protein VE04_08314 [Pseudogymnoascus sp. 24MN13]|nr:hypothetical protein VE04_08314 [Pseudogymnoascus sp. 24MN13]
MPAAPTEPTELLHYLPQHRVLICKECQYAIQPSAISRHLKELHRIYRSNRQKFMKYAEGLDLADPAYVILPGPNEGPVPFLPTIGGLACVVIGCHYLCATDKRMKMHWSAEHSGVVAGDTQCHLVKLQTFFRGNQLRYFIVRHSRTAQSQPERHSVVGSETTTSGISTPDTSLSCESPVAIPEDSRLLEHFQSSTCFELGDSAINISCWHSDVPELAAKYAFLQHGIIACAALHFAFLNPSEGQRYQLIAAHHQNIALPEFRSEIKDANINNYLALLAFTQLLIIHCFAADKHDEDLLLVQGRDDQSLPDWLHVIRGSCDIFKPVSQYVASLPNVAAMMELDLRDRSPERSDYDRRLRGLFDLINSNMAQNIENVEGSFSHLLSTLRLLSRAFTKAQVAQSRNTYSLWVALHVWPVRVSQEYLNLLKQRHPIALILLAHYCILLLPLKVNWYMSSYSRRLITRIYGQLDEEWRPWLQWPLEEIELQCG